MPDSARATTKAMPANDSEAFAFGTVHLDADQAAFYANLNRQVPALCRSLPRSVQTDVLLFCMRYAGQSPGAPVDFFGRYPVPAWSMVYWLSRRATGRGAIAPEIVTPAIQAHAMAMCLHSLDDHLVDGEIPVNHLTLLLRSQAWLVMNRALGQLSGNLPGGQPLVAGYVNDYYDGISDSAPISSLEDYCGRFRKQMATGFIVPALLTIHKHGDRRDIPRIEAAFGAFGLAWRLLDDLQDVRSDLAHARPSSVYLCLSDGARNLWNAFKAKSPSQAENATDSFWDCFQEEDVCGRLCRRIVRELEKAAGIANACGLEGLAHELRCLGAPFHNIREMAS